MHYADGEPARIGDLVTTKQGSLDPDATEWIGVITQVTKGSTSCNANLAVLAKRTEGLTIPVQNAYELCITLSQCLRLRNYGEVPAAPVTPVTPVTTDSAVAAT